MPVSREGKYLVELTNYFSGMDADYELFVGISSVVIDDNYIERLVTKNSADNLQIGMTLPGLMEKASDKSVVLGSDGEGVVSLEKAFR